MAFLFVDSTKPLSKKARELRDASVRSHAARVSHQRRIKAKSRSSPSTSSAEGQHTNIDSIDLSDLNISTDTANSSLSFNDDEAVVRADPDPNTDAVWSSAHNMMLLSPHSVLIRGQSDPFDAWSTPIDSKAHDLISYWRDNYLFRRHHVNAKTWHQSASAVSDWEDARLSFSDEGIGYALLAQVSASIAVDTLSRPLISLSLMYLQRTTIALRKRLENKEDDPSSPRLLRHMVLLQGVETFARNQTAAVTHGKMLRHLYDDWLSSGKRFDVKILLLMLYTDVHMAITFLIRPQFKPSAKLVEAFLEICDAATREECSVPISTTHRPNSQIIDPALQNMFLRWDQNLKIGSFYGRRLWTFMNQINVINHILDIEEEINRQYESSESINTTYCHVQAYLSLAALFLIRLSTLPEHFATKAHFAAHAALLKRLRHHLELSDSSEDKQFYYHARLWALFVGAHSEYQAALLSNMPRAFAVASRGWFNVRLAQQARSCGVRRWVHIKEILESFMYFEMVPDPSVWYSELLR